METAAYFFRSCQDGRAKISLGRCLRSPNTSQSLSLYCIAHYRYLVPPMIDEALARYRAHRQNINRYRSLLQTGLTELEREFIERRIAEEEAAISVLAFDASPPDPPFHTHTDLR